MLHDRPRQTASEVHEKYHDEVSEPDR